ncbi:uncharacterized protein Bfra_003659 [Botrytis fragariae]|uniref:Uncharacterized protein n=1 Tax=Botrytis fragariae TaxID=1964551 RepID=A0A8H6EK43_9HELO|nr:uncharacterized protein Bfra_003659 [Botrytis fragariae]KAF5875206.1 hypothetical protein Bfra_003659 [Botrytis fragariae]
MFENFTDLSGFLLFVATKKLFLEGRCELFFDRRDQGAKFQRRSGMSNSFVGGGSSACQYYGDIE